VKRETSLRIRGKPDRVGYQTTSLSRIPFFLVFFLFSFSLVPCPGALRQEPNVHTIAGLPILQRPVAGGGEWRPARLPHNTMHTLGILRLRVDAAKFRQSHYARADARACVLP
jgi:hypothetical protein